MTVGEIVEKTNTVLKDFDLAVMRPAMHCDSP